MWRKENDQLVCQYSLTYAKEGPIPYLELEDQIGVRPFNKGIRLVGQKWTITFYQYYRLSLLTNTEPNLITTLEDFWYLQGLQREAWSQDLTHAEIILRDHLQVTSECLALCQMGIADKC